MDNFVIQQENRDHVNFKSEKATNSRGGQFRRSYLTLPRTCQPLQPDVNLHARQKRKTEAEIQGAVAKRIKDGMLFQEQNSFFLNWMNWSRN